MIEKICRWLNQKSDDLLDWAMDVEHKKKYGYKYNEIHYLSDSIRDYVLPRIIQKRKLIKKDNWTFNICFGQNNEETITKKKMLKIIDTIIEGFQKWKKEDYCPGVNISHYTKIEEAKKLFSKYWSLF